MTIAVTLAAALDAFHQNKEEDGFNSTFHDFSEEDSAKGENPPEFDGFSGTLDGRAPEEVERAMENAW